MSRARLLPWIVDGGMAAGFSALAIASVLTGGADGYRGTAATWTSAAVGGLAPLPLLLRRRRPMLSLALVCLLRGLPQLLADVDRPFFGGLVLIAVSYGSAVQWARRPRQWFAFLLPVGLLAEYAALDPRFRDPGEWVFDLALFGVAGAIGAILRVLRDRNAALERELAAVERTAALRQQAVVAAEREHIARELHDVIAHSVTAMIVQAGSARLRLDLRPDEVAPALEAVERTGREALAELRRALGLLRAESP